MILEMQGEGVRGVQDPREREREGKRKRGKEKERERGLGGCWLY